MASERFYKSPKLLAKWRTMPLELAFFDALSKNLIDTTSNKLQAMLDTIPAKM